MAQGQAMAVEVDGVMMLVCGWFARCGNPTLKVYDHPALGMIPTCDRCRMRAGVAASALQDVEVQS